jgi:fermentation-respiration switch protein FrsA (DUF1100 family)
MSESKANLSTDGPSDDAPSVTTCPDSPASRRPTWRRCVIRWGVIVFGTYLSVCVALLVCQSHLIYFPTRGVAMTPADVQLPFERVELATLDGVNLVGWYVPSEPARGTVLLFHGNAGNLSDVLFDYREWRRLGFNVFGVDYRGFGESEGSPTEQGLYRDAEAAWAHVVNVRREDPGRIVVFGRSLGGAVAIELASRHEPAAVIVESTFTTLPDVGALHYPLLPVRLLALHRYESVHRIPHLRCPKLILHGREDRLIPMALGRRLFEAAAEPKAFIETGGDHSDAGVFYDHQTTEQVSAWLSRVMTAPASP